MGLNGFDKRLNFERDKVRQNIKRQGETFVFKRAVVNDFGEPTGTFSEVTVFGIFHQSQSYISQSVGDGTVSRTRFTPQIMALSEDLPEILNGDLVEYNNRKYSVTGVSIYNEFNVAVDISLEVVDNGI